MSTINQLTPEKLKTFKGLENLTDEEAIRLTQQVNTLAKILISAKPIKRLSTDENEHSANG